MFAIAPVDIKTFRLDAADDDGLAHRLFQRMAVIGIALEHCGSQNQSFAVGCRDADLAAELVRGAGLAFGDAFDFRGVQCRYRP